jgi:hypothetical protein
MDTRHTTELEPVILCDSGPRLKLTYMWFNGPDSTTRDVIVKLKRGRCGYYYFLPHDETKTRARPTGQGVPIEDLDAAWEGNSITTWSLLVVKDVSPIQFTTEVYEI